MFTWNQDTGPGDNKTYKKDVESIVIDVKREQKDLYELIKIATSRGGVDCAYRRAEGTVKGIIMLRI